MIEEEEKETFELTQRQVDLIRLAIETHLNSLTTQDREKFDEEYQDITNELVLLYM